MAKTNKRPKKSLPRAWDAYAGAVLTTIVIIRLSPSLFKIVIVIGIIVIIIVLFIVIVIVIVFVFIVICFYCYLFWCSVRRFFRFSSIKLDHKFFYVERNFLKFQLIISIYVSY